MQEQLQKLGIVKAFKGIKKQVYYYQQQLLEYKSWFDDPSKLEAKLTELVLQIPVFQQFFAGNSQLGSLFALPGNSNPTAMLAGLQTRAMVQQDLTARFGAGTQVQQMLQQNMGEAQGMLNELKNKINSLGTGASDEELPDFKPNNQKTKSLLKRLELGTNLQTQRATNFFPVTSDLGLSIGYKMSDKSIIGVGASYKMGWGKGWNNINITQQGVGLRSFVDIKLKGSFWISGGYEQNYKPRLREVIIPSPGGGSRMGAGWTKSGLIGISKVVSLKTKLFKKTKFQLLWDFLSYQEIPRTQPIVFRIGYNF